MLKKIMIIALLSSLVSGCLPSDPSAKDLKTPCVSNDLDVKSPCVRRSPIEQYRIV